MASENIQVFTDGNFDQSVKQAQHPVLVDFWAEWCGPCRRIAPVVDELATEYQGKVTIAKLNVDENPMTPGKFNVRGIPALLLFKGGELVEQIVGLADKGTLKKLLDRHV